MVFPRTAPQYVGNIGFNPFPARSEIGMVTADLINCVDNHLDKKLPFDRKKVYSCTEYLLSPARNNSEEAHHLIAQQIRHGLKHARLTNNTLYRNWLDRYVNRLRVSVSDKQDLMSILVAFRVHSQFNTFEKLCNYTIDNFYEGQRNNQILDNVLIRCKEKNGNEKIAHYQPFIKNCLRNSAYMNFGVSQRQELLETMLAKDTFYDYQTMRQICDYQTETPAEGQRNIDILGLCVQKLKENGSSERVLSFRPVIDNCFKNQEQVSISTELKQDLLAQMLLYGGDCSLETMQSLSRYHIETASQRQKQTEIEQLIDTDIKEHWLWSGDLKRISFTMGGFCEANPDMNLCSFNHCSEKYLQILNESECPKDISLMPLLKLMEARTKVQPNDGGMELFSEQQALPETIDKRMFGEFLNQVLKQTLKNGGINKSSKQFQVYTSNLLLYVMENHSFSKKEMLGISRTIKQYPFNSESTDAYYSNLNTKMQQIYNGKMEREVLNLGEWARKQKIEKSLEEKLAVRSTYIDILHERLINDKSVGNINLNEALAERRIRFDADAHGNYEKDKLKANRIVQAIKSFYRNKNFVGDIKTVTLHLDHAEIGEGINTQLMKRRKYRS